MTLLERLEVAIEHARDKGLVTSRRSIGRAASDAGLKMSASYVDTLLTRLRKDPHMDVDVRFLERIASVLNVSAAWLRTGEGPMVPAVTVAVASASTMAAPDTQAALLALLQQQATTIQQLTTEISELRVALERRARSTSPPRSRVTKRGR